MFEHLHEPFKRQPHKIVKQTQAIRLLLSMNCLSLFYHFVGLALKRLITPRNRAEQLINMFGP